MKKKIMAICIIIITLFLFYALFLDKIIPIHSYINLSTEITLNDTQTSIKNSKVGIGYSVHYTKIYSERVNKYFIVLYFHQKKYGDIPPIISSKIKNITFLVNQNDITNPKYGTIENPIPIMNYKIKDEYVFDQKQYEYNVRKYLAYRRWINFCNFSN